MYGTIARMKVKPGEAERLLEFMKQEEPGVESSGLVATYVYRMDNDPNELYLAVLFTDRESYRRNADSPEQDEMYRKMVSYLDGEPEWHDGEVIQDSTRR